MIATEVGLSAVPDFLYVGVFTLVRGLEAFAAVEAEELADYGEGGLLLHFL